MTQVPDARELTLAAAFDLIRGSGLQPVLLGLPTMKSTGDFGYLVAAQEPPPGCAVEAGTRVVLAARTRLLSFGSIDGPPVAAPGTPVPDVLGVELEPALARVTSQGFIGVVFQPARGVEQLGVSRQEPSPGEPVGRFREVVLMLD